MLSTPVLLALATPASAAVTPVSASTVQSAAVPAANPCPAIRVFNLEGTGAFSGLAPGTTPPPDFQSAAPFSPDRALTNLSQASGGQADYFTINYPAASGLAIFASEQAGVAETERQATAFLAQCSTSTIELLGYSQGAWVAGDVATDIANNKVPGVTPDKVVASFLVGDPVNQATQQPGYGTEIGAVTGAGPLPARFAGFGANNATTFEFCNPGDTVCDDPPAPPGSPASIGNLLSVIGGPTPQHLMYNTVEVAPGLSSVAYIRQYILAHLPPVVVPPVVTTPPVILTPVAGSTVPGTDPITGTAPAGATVTVTAGGTTVCVVVATAAGTFSCTPTTPLPAGATTITATETDPTGAIIPVGTVVPPATVTITVGGVVVPPVGGVIPPVILTPVAGSTVPGTDPITGTAPAGATVTVTAGGTTVCVVVATSTGTFSCTPTAPLPAGATTITATVTDPTGLIVPVGTVVPPATVMITVGGGVVTPPVTTPPVVAPVVVTPPVVVPVAPPVVVPPAVVSDPGVTAVVPPGAGVTPFRIDTGLGANAVAAPAPTQVLAAPSSTSTNYPMLSVGLGILMAGGALLAGLLYRRRAR